jgi:DNA-binding phage protein
MDAIAEQSIYRKCEMLGAILDERGRRLWAAVEASQLGRGGVSVVARATGLSRTTIYQGTEELNQSQGTGCAGNGSVHREGVASG